MICTKKPKPVYLVTEISFILSASLVMKKDELITAFLKISSFWSHQTCSSITTATKMKYFLPMLEGSHLLGGSSMNLM